MDVVGVLQVNDFRRSQCMNERTTYVEPSNENWTWVSICVHKGFVIIVMYIRPK